MLALAALGLAFSNVHVTAVKKHNSSMSGAHHLPSSSVTSAWLRNEVDYLAPPSSRDPHASDSYIGSPSIVNTGQGWLASHDRFFNEAIGTTYVFGASAPEGSWELKATVSPMYWAQLFLNDGVPNAAVYLIGLSDDMSGSGDIVISRCVRTAAQVCSGSHWTKPTVLFAGNASAKFHAAPTPVVAMADARRERLLLRAFDVGALPSRELSVVMVRAYARCADLTERSCWRMSAGLPFDQAWLPGGHSGRMWEEPGAIVDRAGRVSVMVRLDGALDGCNDLSSCNRAILLHYDVPTATLAFEAVVAFPSGSNKFKVAWREDGRADVLPLSHFYALTNPVTQVPTTNFPPGTGQRSLLLLAHSTDLHSWQSCAPVAFDDTNVYARALHTSSRSVGKA